MKHKALLVLSVSSLCGILAAPLGAQSMSPIQANIPFEFAVSGKTMPAGTYTVVDLSVSPPVVQVRQSGAAHESVYFNTIDARLSVTGDQPTLTFRRYGNRYFLAEISHGGGSQILGVPTSRVEREAIRTSSSHPVQLVTLAALRVVR